MTPMPDKEEQLALLIDSRNKLSDWIDAHLKVLNNDIEQLKRELGIAEEWVNVPADEFPWPERVADVHTCQYCGHPTTRKGGHLECAIADSSAAGGGPRRD